MYLNVIQNVIANYRSFHNKLTLAIETRKKITGLISYLKGTGYKGIKYI